MPQIRTDMKPATHIAVLFFSLIALPLMAQPFSFTTYTDQYKKGEKQGETSVASYVVDGDRFAMSTYMSGLKVMTNVADLEERKMTMITYAGKNAQGIEMKMPHPDSIPPQTDTSMMPIVKSELKPTDEVKNADGYQCRRYEMETSTAYMEVWMLEGHDLDLLGVFHRFTGNLGGPAGLAGPTFMQIPLEKGFPMELYYEPRDGKIPATLTRVSQLKIGDVDTSDLDVSGVQMIEMPENQ